MVPKASRCGKTSALDLWIPLAVRPEKTTWELRLIFEECVGRFSIGYLVMYLLVTSLCIECIYFPRMRFFLWLSHIHICSIASAEVNEQDSVKEGEAIAPANTGCFSGVSWCFIWWFSLFCFTCLGLSISTARVRLQSHVHVKLLILLVKWEFLLSLRKVYSISWKHGCWSSIYNVY